MAKDEMFADFERGWRDSPAFPNEFGDDQRGVVGLTRREYVAARALQGVLANVKLVGDANDVTESAASLALEAADRLLALLYRREVEEDADLIDDSERP